MVDFCRLKEALYNIFFFYSILTVFCAIKIKQNQGTCKFFNFQFQLKLSCVY